MLGGGGDVLVAPWGSWWRGQKSARLSSDVMFKVCDYVLYRELILCVYNKAWQRGGTGPPPPNKKMKIAEDLNWIVTLTRYKLIEKGYKMLHKNSQKKSVLICPPPPQWWNKLLQRWFCHKVFCFLSTSSDETLLSIWKCIKIWVKRPKMKNRKSTSK